MSDISALTKQDEHGCVYCCLCGGHIHPDYVEAHVEKSCNYRYYLAGGLLQIGLMQMVVSSDIKIAWATPLASPQAARIGIEATVKMSNGMKLRFSDNLIIKTGEQS